MKKTGIPTGLINIQVKNKYGHPIDLNNTPQMKSCIESSEQAKFVACKLREEERIKELYKNYIGEEPTIETLTITIESAALILLIGGITDTQKTGRKKEYILKAKSEFGAIKKHLEKALKAFDSLDNELKNTLGMATSSQQIDFKIIKQLIESCDSASQWLYAPTKYFAPLNNAFLSFKLDRFDICYSTQLTKSLDELSRTKINFKDWSFFKTLMELICFELFQDNPDNPPERLRDTEIGLAPSFNKIKEIRRLYFTTDFPD